MDAVIVNNPRTSYFVGGSEMVSMEHAKAMHQLGFDVTFLTIDPASIGKSYSQQYLDFKRVYSKNICFEELKQDKKALHVYAIEPGEDRTRWNTEALLYNRSLFTFLSKGKCYKVLLSYFNIDALVIPSDKVENSMIYLSGVPKDENIFRHTFLSSYDTLLAITEETKQYWDKYAQKPIRVVHTGVDSNRFKPGERNNKKVEILFVGRLIERKGCDILLRAITRIDNDIHVTVVGDGPQRMELEDLCKDLAISSRVSFTGAVNNPEWYMANADICVFPSSRGEGLQGVLLEAMASGASIIAANTKINSELLADGRGIVVDATEEKVLREAIIKLIENPSLRKIMGTESRKYVISHFNWDTLTKKILGKSA
jgi:glycosyltransferase involved in cell wall biosynthesis